MNVKEERGTCDRRRGKREREREISRDCGRACVGYFFEEDD